MKKQTLEELIKEARKMSMVYNDDGSETGVIMLKDVSFEAFIKKVYEAGGEAERERKGNFKPIINHSCTNPVSCPWCNSESIKVIIATT